MMGLLIVCITNIIIKLIFVAASVYMVITDHIGFAITYIVISIIAGINYNGRK